MPSFNSKKLRAANANNVSPPPALHDSMRCPLPKWPDSALNHNGMIDNKVKKRHFTLQIAIFSVFQRLIDLLKFQLVDHRPYLHENDFV